MSSITIAPVAPSVHPEIAEYQGFLDANAGLHKVGQRTYCAVGFGGNISFIEGERGIILVNSGSFVEWSAQALAAYREISDKPIVAIIYTHGYSDHTGGVRAFVPPGEEDGVAVYANAVWRDYVGQATSPMQPEVILRAAAQLGWLLPHGMEASLGSILSRYMPTLGAASYLAPNHDVTKPTRVSIEGVALDLIPAPHDVDDGMIVWMPDEKLLFSGDTLMPGKMYPPIATPRFEPRRDPQKWVQTMGLAASLGANLLIPAYGMPLYEAAEIRKRLVGQQKLSQYMIDETNRLTLEGHTAAEVAAMVQVPAELERDFAFSGLYHRFSWIIRSLISREFGWFGGDALDYVRHDPRDKAQRLARELGGRGAMVERAAAAQGEGDFPWALELASDALLLDPSDEDARAVRRAALHAIAYSAASSNERNFLLTTAAIDDGALNRSALLRAFRGKAPRDTDLLRPAARLLDLMGPKLRRDVALREGPLRVRINVADRDETLKCTIVDGVLLRGPDPDGAPADLELRLPYAALIRGVEAMTPFDILRANGEVEILRGEERFAAFLACFDW